MERTGIIKFKGQDVTIVGRDLLQGDLAPEFTAHTQDWTSIQVLQSTTGKVRLIASLPSLDTEVCDRETRRFNQEAATLGADVALVMISADLPFAQKRWCGIAGIESIILLSDHLTMDFGLKYACLMKEVRLLRRAIFVIDRNGKITYAAYMPALGVEPEYEEVLKAIRASL